MAKYVSKPVEIEATQWFKDGDHPYVVKNDLGTQFAVSGVQGWSNVNSGDWIIKEPFASGHYPCADDVFKNKYELKK